jgi:hypothetical protein
MRDVRTYLLTVQPTDLQGGYLCIARRLSACEGQPAFARLAAGSPLELVRPDGTPGRAWVVDFSTDQIQVYGRDHDGTVFLIKGDPLYRLRVGPRLTDFDAPPGTEIWLLGDPPADW